MTEIKNGRLAQIAFGGIIQHYLLTGKGPVQFITQIPNFKSCVANAASLPGAKVASSSSSATPSRLPPTSAARRVSP